MSHNATVTGYINRIAFSRGIPDELIVELYNDRTVITLVAYGHTARVLSNFLIAGKQYVVDYEPSSSGDFQGEVFSARDRNG